MSTTTLSSKGQITISKRVREKLGLKPGDKLDMDVETGKIVLIPSKKPSVSLRGIGAKTKETLKISSVELVRQLRREDEEEL